MTAPPQGLAARATGPGQDDVAAPLTVVTVGTSLTSRGGWQEALERQLSVRLMRPVFVQIVARAGETSLWGCANLEAVVALKPDVVLVEFAANDAALQRRLSLGRSLVAMRTILERLLSCTPRPRVVVMAMNPVSGLRGLVRPRLTTYIAAHRDLAWALGAEFLDHRPAWNRLGRAARARAIPDGLHPIPAEAAAIMVPALVEHLGRSQDTP
ncbi:SGNH/GDSL hydrolase family protein [Methylobacterium sp. Leaf89]|uniref:SGNH/GDSL hydrolase family protein n=1 Tax=Methylobacterium sp. Leaf89 TaxID=1736245 RepID=UPI0006FBF61D|nr:SGNH/GDSL hydrolase family protein [Methylobacterium sp. Leaf89]KQO69360.1 hypothetical protein ASF18_02735 [Methylobacterium sp. Leaf89]